jgi:hypothetical protein
MRVPVSGLCAIALIAALQVQAQEAPSAPANKAAPTGPTIPVKTMPPEELDLSDWSAQGATAQCLDGTYFHGQPTQRTCADHGGVRKWLQQGEQPLIR